jgi:hypothetical protein
MKAGVQKYITDDFHAGINSLALRCPHQAAPPT